MTDTIERLGRIKHPDLGECVKVRLRSWDGPIYPGDKGKEVWEEFVFPKDQWKYKFHPRYPRGFEPGYERTSINYKATSVAPSCSFYDELIKYGNFRWNAPND